MGRVPTLACSHSSVSCLLFKWNAPVQESVAKLSPNLSGDARQCGWIPKLRTKKGLLRWFKYIELVWVSSCYSSTFWYNLWTRGQLDRTLQSTFNSKVLFEKPLLTCILFVNGSLPLVATMVCVLHTLCQSGSYNQSMA